MAEPVAPLDFTADPYWGLGGRYVVDPATGCRQPATDTPDETAPALDNAVSAEAPAEPAPVTKKGK